MQWNRASKLTLAAATVAMAAAASGFVAPSPVVSALKGVSPVGIRVLRPQLTTAKNAALEARVGAKGGSVKVDARTGIARVITGAELLTTAPLEALSSPDDYVDQALRYVAANAATLGVDASDLVLERNATLISDDVQFLKFRVQREGLIVEDSTLDFRFAGGTLVQVVNRTYAEAQADNRDLVAGLDRAAADALLAASATQTGEKLRVVEGDNGYNLVRVAQFDVTSQDGRLFKVEVEAATGNVFEVRPTSFYLDGTAAGSVYPRTYWHDDAATDLPYRDLNLSAGTSTITTDATGKFTGVARDAQIKMNGFAGVRVKVVPKTGTAVAITGSLSGDQWTVHYQKGNDTDNADKNMAQSMTYFHLNKEINHAKQFISTAWLDRQLTANVNLAQTCNAYWDGSSVNLFSAGGGCANTALISDVFYHEWGHGLDANTGGIEDGGFSEGFGDIMALAMTHSNVIGKGFKISDGSGVRDLTTLKVYPADAGSEVHTEGLIIGGTFWDLFVGLKAAYGEAKAGDVLSNLALKQIFTASHYTDVYDAVNVIDAATAHAAAGHGPNFCIINAAFTRHGLATADSSCH